MPPALVITLIPGEREGGKGVGVSRGIFLLMAFYKSLTRRLHRRITEFKIAKLNYLVYLSILVIDPISQTVATLQPLRLSRLEIQGTI